MDNKKIVQNIIQDGKNTITMCEFSNVMTVRDLKEVIKGWPEINECGGDCEVWIETGRNVSNPVVAVGPLNLRKEEGGEISADFILESNLFNE